MSQPPPQDQYIAARAALEARFQELIACAWRYGLQVNLPEEQLVLSATDATRRYDALLRWLDDEAPNHGASAPPPR